MFILVVNSDLKQYPVLFFILFKFVGETGQVKILSVGETGVGEMGVGEMGQII